MKLAAATVQPRICCITLALVAGLSVSAVSALQSPASASDTENCSDSRCLAKLAVQDLKEVDDEHLAEFARNLARLGIFDEARAAAARIKPDGPKAPGDRKFVLRDIALSQVADAAWVDRERPADLGSIDALALMESSDESFQTAGDYWLVAGQILYRSPFTGVSPDLAKLLRLKLIRREQNATLIHLLHTTWPRVIEKLPEGKRGTYWDYVAQVCIDINDLQAAAESLELAESSGAYDFRGVNQVYTSTARTWLRMGRFDRALTAARRASSKSAMASIQIDLVKTLIAAGSKKEALALLAEALANAHQVSNSPLAYFLTILNLHLDAGDQVGAHRIAEEVFAQARKPSLLPASELALAARAYNDIGERQRAAEILRDAIAKVPAPNHRIGTGVTIGPIFGSTLGLDESIRSQIAAELYRAGDRQGFKTLLRDLTPWYQQRTWIDLYAAALRRGEFEPSESEVLNELQDDFRLRFLNGLATDALSVGNTAKASQLLRSAIEEARTEPHIRTLVESAKVAIAGDLSEIAAEALRVAGRIALKTDEPGRRAADLAFVAALQYELLGK